MRFGSLFSGIGGFDLGLERAGMEVAWQVEIDPFCQKVLEKHWPGVKRYGDIRKLKPGELELVDLICGGFPCQPVSVAGKQLAQNDERWLWPEFARIICTVRPKYIVVENVPGLLNRGMGDVLGDLAAFGYDAEWAVLSACTMGAPHTRERLFLVAYPNGQHGEKGLGAFVDWPSAHECNSSAKRAQHWMVPFAGIRGVVDGIPRQVDRIRSVGNAVVPELVEIIGRAILAAEGREVD